MTALPTSPSLLLLASIFPLLTGVLLMAWGRKAAQRGGWMTGLGLLAALLVAALGWSVLSEETFAPQTWARGWIGPREELGSITVGVIRDVLGMAIATVTTLLAGSLLMGSGAQVHKHRPDRFYASLSFSTAGVILAWFSLTPWLALTGVVLTIFGGFLAIGARWHQPIEAAFATRFGWERSWGIILAALGLCVLAGGKVALTLVNVGDGWTTGSSGSFTELLGAGMLFAGAIVQLQPFPLLGWVTTASETPCSSRVVLAQVFPAWAVFAVLIRLDPQFHEVGLFPGLGWIGLVSALLSSVAGVMRPDWRQSLSAWVSAGFSLSVAVLAFAGPSPAFCLMLGTGLAASALAGFGSVLAEGGEAKGTHRQRAIWSKVGCGVAAASGTGVVGFATAGGSVRWMTFVVNQPVLLSASIAVFFLFAFLGWKVAWTSISLKHSSEASWASVLSPYFPVLLALGIVWTGSATGGILPDSTDRLFPSPLEFLFGPKGEAWGDASDFGTASLLHWVGLGLAIGLAYITAGKRTDFWPKAIRTLPRFSAFVASGYGMDPLFARITALLSKMGSVSQWLVDRKTWDLWMPWALATGLGRGAAVVARADSRLSWWIGGSLRRWVEVPSKLLQIIQNGDVQWYLFFAVSSGIAILAHFMRG